MRLAVADGFLDNARRMAEILRDRLDRMAARHPKVIESVRGAGLLLGLKCVVANDQMIARLREAGLLTIPAADNVVRLLPPLIIDEGHVEAASEILDSVCGGWESDR